MRISESYLLRAPLHPTPCSLSLPPRRLERTPLLPRCGPPLPTKLRKGMMLHLLCSQTLPAGPRQVSAWGGTSDDVHDESEPSEQQGVPRNVPGGSGNEFLCVRCSATTPVGFLSKAALDRRVELCHASAPDTSNAPTSSATTIKKSEEAHTKVVHFAADNVVDAAACASTPEYNALCPDGLRPNATSSSPAEQTSPERQASPTQQSSPPQKTSHTHQPTNNQQQAGMVFCDKCGQGCSTRKGLTYHMLRDHGVPVGKRDDKRTGATYEPRLSSTAWCGVVVRRGGASSGVVHVP
ncbi:hypothetical protein TNCV_4954851 [Trichonephila clavipes]|nr:hypothetical protein TNCV_4954851 [Trichonephila clavipes]